MGAQQKSDDALSPLLGSDVSGFGGLLELSGAGIFGFLINLPIVSYYEIGTALTAESCPCLDDGRLWDASVGLALFCQRYMIPEEPLVGSSGQNQFLVA